MMRRVLLAFFILALIVLGARAGFSASEVIFRCSFSNSPTDCGFEEQSKPGTLSRSDAGRAALVGVARDGSTAVRLTTYPGDNNVYGSGSNERNDLSLSQAATGCHQGAQQWWSHSIRFPDDYVVPPAGTTWHWGIVFNFHHTGSGGQANLQVASTSKGLFFWVAGGPSVVRRADSPYFHQAAIGPVVKNTWYDFVYNVRWSAYSDGFIKGWVNGDQKLDYRGPTLYAGQGCYLKLANYHSAVGKRVSVIHDRIVRGTTSSAVSTRALLN